MQFIGEAWQDIMMHCISSPDVKCYKPEPENFTITASAYVSDSEGIEGMDLSMEPEPPVMVADSCGSDFAYAYFISFFVFCSFLVSILGFIAFKASVKKI